MSIWAVVIARVGNGAKSRLAGVLDVGQRHELALAMLNDVLDVCTSPEAPLDGTIAVANQPIAIRTSRVLTIQDAGCDMNLAALIGLQAAHRYGATTAIVLPGDIPLLSAKDLQLLVATAAHHARAVVVGASRDRQGTNALLLRPPDAIVPAFGPPSVERHVRLGDSAGATTHVLHNLGLALDVDTPPDLAALADLPVGARTAEFLVAATLSRI
jgi:2-phospho-L-lactate guanylyltransferase